MSKAAQASPTSSQEATPAAAAQMPEATSLPSIASLGRRLAALDAEYDRLATLPPALEGEASCDTSWAMGVIQAQRDALRAAISTIPAVAIEDAAIQIAIAFHLVGDLTDKGLSVYETQQASSALDRLILSALPVIAAAADLAMDAMGWEVLVHFRTTRFAGLEGVR